MHKGVAILPHFMIQFLNPCYTSCANHLAQLSASARSTNVSFPHGSGQRTPASVLTHQPSSLLINIILFMDGKAQMSTLPSAPMTFLAIGSTVR